jgi:triacylglycerol lipase
MKTRLSIISLLLNIICFSQSTDLIEELNPSFLNDDFSTYNQKSALYFGQLSELAYSKEKNIAQIANEVRNKYSNNRLNYTYIKAPKTHSQALLWCTNDFLVISFRGTEPSKIKDWITDAKFWNYENNPSQKETLANMPPGHGGFRKALIELIKEQRLFEQINDIVKKTSPSQNIEKFPIYLTGHSLGAAISQLFIECLNFKKYNLKGAYHFAPPLAVSCEYRDYMKEKYGNSVFDIVNYKDYVPRAGRNFVAHFGKFYRICNDNLIYKENEAYVKLYVREYLKEAKYHSLTSHLTAIRNQKNKFEQIKLRSKGDFPCMGEHIKNIDPCAKIK